MRVDRCVVSGLLVSAFGTWVFFSPAAVASPNGNCDSAGCHAGIEPVSLVSMRFGCTMCHQGDDKASDKVTAHLGMYANPSDLRVAEETCGQCHKHVVESLKKSLHATSAGVISGTRWAWAAQDTKNAIYANYDVSNYDHHIPMEKGALASLEQIPRYDPSAPESFENSPADDYLRNQCLRCHVWSGGHERAGDYRASGCAACHAVYNDDGVYRGSDEAILAYQADPNRERKAFPRIHRLTTKIPAFQCIHCHNRGGRTGVSFIGTMESDGYGSPWTETGGKQPQLHGKNYNFLSPDIHYERGLACIDCHTEQDLHGDGNIYSKKELAVEIECVDCHGTLTEESNLKSSWGNRLHNLKRRGHQIVLISKMDGTEHVVPQIVDIQLSLMGQTAMRSLPHVEKLECYACHARWAPQCYGCHAKQDLRSTGRDWIDPVPDPDDPSKTARKAAADAAQLARGWAETRSYLRWETPVLGINPDSEGNLVAPFIPGCQIFFTQIGEDGNAVVHNKVYTTVDGTSGIAHNPMQTHTVSDRPRICEDCHNNPKALGLGSGTYDSWANGVDIGFELDRIVDEEGDQIQTTLSDGARPLTAAQLELMQMDQTCSGCHR